MVRHPRTRPTRRPGRAAGSANRRTPRHALIRARTSGASASDRIVLAGFSQGGAIALFAGLRHPERLAGILALSTYLPLEGSLAAEAHPANAAVPVFMAHGRFDDVVPLALGQGSRDFLAGRGYEVDWRTYPDGAQPCPEEIEDVRAWLLRVLPPR